MARTTNLRAQHEKLLSDAVAIDKLVSSSNLATSAQDIRLKISSMIGVLQMHLSSEDKVLYPDMVASLNPKTRETAEKFIKEMGRLGETVKDFNNKWTVQYISSNPAFKAEWKTVLNVLGDRVNRENTELYPLADQM